MKSISAHSYIPTLNGWRAFSIVYVLLYHSTWIYFNPQTGLYPNELYWKLSKNGAFGVYFFFGISGYLITTRLIEEYKFFGNISLKSFYLRRFFRIIPVLLIFLSIISALKWSQMIEVPTISILSSIFFFRNYTADVSEWYTGHFWSLSMEEHYYLIWPALFLFTIKMKRAWILIMIILASVTIWRTLEYRYHLLAPYLPTTEFRGRTDLFFDYMMWGSLFAFLNAQSKFKIFFFRFTRPWFIIFAIFFMHTLFLIKIPFQDSVQSLLIQFCLLLSINYPESSFSKFLENKTIARIGVYSYSLYVWQQLVLTPANMRLKGFEFLQTPPLNILLLCIIAYISFNFLENPVINFGKKILNKMNLSR